MGKWQFATKKERVQVICRKIVGMSQHTGEKVGDK